VVMLGLRATDCELSRFEFVLRVLNGECGLVGPLNGV